MILSFYPSATQTSALGTSLQFTVIRGTFSFGNTIISYNYKLYYPNYKFTLVLFGCNLYIVALVLFSHSSAFFPTWALQ